MHTRFFQMVIVTFLLLQTGASANECPPSAVGIQPAPTAKLCDILGSSKDYDGKRVVVFATYRVDFEASELYCLSCSELGGVWIEFDSLEGGAKAAKILDRLFSKRAGTANGIFTGVFHSGRHYGHLGSWSNELSVDSVRSLELIDRVGTAPKALGTESRSKVCQ
jgi:hypothetical protein